MNHSLLSGPGIGHWDLIFSLCFWLFCFHVCLCAWHSRQWDGSIRSPGPGVIDSCEPMHGCWERIQVPQESSQCPELLPHPSSYFIGLDRLLLSSQRWAQTSTVSSYFDSGVLGAQEWVTVPILRLLYFYLMCTDCMFAYKCFPHLEFLPWPNEHL